MKYNSLKRQGLKHFKVPEFDGGVDLKSPKSKIKNNQLSECENMWFQDSRLKTRPGFYGEEMTALKTEIYGYSGELEYNITDTVVYHNESYHRIATADVLTDDYAHYTYVYLIDLYGNITPIGNLKFLRISSEIFYTPISILFYNGKSDTGGGIFAFVTLQNEWNSSQRYYHIYEIDESLSEWNRVYDYYVPTIYINGRGNLYDTAHQEAAFSTPNPQTLESPNMLNGRFNAYYTSDGYSNSFRLPFVNIAKETVVCRIYYTLLDFVEWTIAADANKCTKSFQGKDVTAVIDRTKGTVYFTCDGDDYSVALMPKYHENNIKITATKEIPLGFSRVVHSTCCVRNNSKLLISGGESGNTVFVTSYDNPLYFPQNSCADVGSIDAEITALSVQQGKILAFKTFEIYALDFKEGETVNEISLLTDNDMVFKKADKITVTRISERIGCENKRTLAVCKNSNIWQGADNNVYLLESATTGSVVNLSEQLGSFMPEYNVKHTFAVGNEEFYFLINKNRVIVLSLVNKAVYLWSIPSEIRLESGFYHNATFRFLCTSADSKIAYVTTLQGDRDVYMYFDQDENIVSAQKSISCSMTTKHFKLVNMGNFVGIDSIYVSLSAAKKVELIVNSKEVINLNFGYLNEEYNTQEHNSVRLIPHLYGVDTVYLTIASQDFVSVGETEISYRIKG